jgi:hypothetical protein
MYVLSHYASFSVNIKSPFDPMLKYSIRHIVVRAAADITWIYCQFSLSLLSCRCALHMHMWNRTWKTSGTCLRAHSRVAMHLRRMRLRFFLRLVLEWRRLDAMRWRALAAARASESGRTRAYSKRRRIESPYHVCYAVRKRTLERENRVYGQHMAYVMDGYRIFCWISQHLNGPVWPWSSV